MLCTHSSHETNDPDLWNCGTEWVRSATLLRPLFTNFIFRHSWDRKWGCWCKICTVHNSVCVMPNPLAKTWESKSGPYGWMPLVLPTQPYNWVGKTSGVQRYGPEYDSHVFASGLGITQTESWTVQILHQYPHFRSHEWRKRKFVKSGRSSVVLCTHSVPQL